MADVTLELAEEHRSKTKEEVLTLLDDEVVRFSTYMARLEDSRARGPLGNGEKALVKTFLVAKLRGKF